MFGLAILFFVISMSLLYVTIKQYYFDKSDPNIQKEISLNKNDPYRNVKKYTPLLQKELKKYKLEKYAIVLTAIMYQESQGMGGDPMQSSESAGLPPNSIQNPQKSIQLGVKHFHHVLTYGKKNQVDFPTIIQGYNMGLGYISYIAKHGGMHSENLAKNFSLIQVKNSPNIYNCGGNQKNFRYPYCYGDFTYSTKVEKNIIILTSQM